ncbi:Rv0361 family membrane protein [Catellatospora methionotrophica]|uniref:Rv0361 family membrane protein n=1 Tax=Catellatospora methionotrophica TaxID=121620 RepID=UPI0033C3EF57
MTQPHDEQQPTTPQPTQPAYPPPSDPFASATVTPPTTPQPAVPLPPEAEPTPAQPTPATLPIAENKPASPVSGAPAPVSGTPAPAFPTPPTAAYPSPPQSGYPVSGQPAYPAQPGYPTSGQPTYPTSGQPTYPAAGQPAYPVSGQPAYPTSGQPAYPVSGQPAYPTSGQPAYPVSGQPAYPGMTYPGAPGAPAAPPKKSKAPLIIGLVLGVLLLLCGGGIGAYVLLTRNTEGTGATTAKDATQSFLTAIYKSGGNADAAEKLVCGDARDRKAIEAKIAEIKSQTAQLKGPNFTWETPKISGETATQATADVTVKLVTSDEKMSEQKLTLTLVKHEGWFVCEVK